MSTASSLEIHTFSLLRHTDYFSVPSIAYDEHMRFFSSAVSVQQIPKNSVSSTARGLHLRMRNFNTLCASPCTPLYTYCTSTQFCTSQKTITTWNNTLQFLASLLLLSKYKFTFTCVGACMACYAVSPNRIYSSIIPSYRQPYRHHYSSNFNWSNIAGCSRILPTACEGATYEMPVLQFNSSYGRT